MAREAGWEFGRTPFCGSRLCCPLLQVWLIFFLPGASFSPTPSFFASPLFHHHHLGPTAWHPTKWMPPHLAVLHWHVTRETWILALQQTQSRQICSRSHLVAMKERGHVLRSTRWVELHVGKWHVRLPFTDGLKPVFARTSLLCCFLNRTLNSLLPPGTPVRGLRWCYTVSKQLCSGNLENRGIRTSFIATAEASGCELPWATRTERNWKVKSSGEKLEDCAVRMGEGDSLRFCSRQQTWAFM